MKPTLNIHDRLLVEAREVAVRRRRAMPVFRSADGRGGLAPDLSGLSTRELLDRIDDAA